MDTEQYFEEAVAHGAMTEEDKNSLEKWKSTPDPTMDSDDNPTGSFDCNICLDSVQDPVVTLCGHLYCWPCIYKWLSLQRIPTEDQEQRQQQCPVCKAEVSETTLVPLYGRGISKKAPKGKDRHLLLMIPKRPLAPGCGVETPRSPSTVSPRVGQQLYHQDHSYGSPAYLPHQGYFPSPSMMSPRGQTANTFDPMIGFGPFGEAVYARVFGNSVTNFVNYPNSYNFVGSTSPRIRRHIIQADRSLSRICFFLFCCVLLCLLSF